MEKTSYPHPQRPECRIVVKHYDDGHYYVNIFDYSEYRYLLSEFLRTSLRQLKSVGIL